jgi:hypothetical protein
MKFNPICPGCGTFRDLENTSIMKKRDSTGEAYDCLYYICKACTVKRNLRIRMRKQSTEKLLAMLEQHCRMAELYRKEILKRRGASDVS